MTDDGFRSAVGLDALRETVTLDGRVIALCHREGAHESGHRDGSTAGVPRTTIRPETRDHGN